MAWHRFHVDLFLRFSVLHLQEPSEITSAHAGVARRRLARRIALHGDLVLGPGLGDGIDDAPGFLSLISADEERGTVVKHLEDQIGVGTALGLRGRHLQLLLDQVLHRSR